MKTRGFKDPNIEKGFESGFPEFWLIALRFELLRKKIRNCFIYTVKKK